MSESRVNNGSYTDVSYLQFNKSRTLLAFERIAGVLTWPVLWPLAMLSRHSELLFRTMSEFLSVIPYVFGIVSRYEFYRFALQAVGKNVQIEFGAIFIQRDISIGSNVLIGRYCIFHHCDIGNYVLIGERCTFLSGSRQHSFERMDIPIALQGGQKKRIRIDDDCWIGSHAVVMDSVSSGAVVAAGSVVTRYVDRNQIVAGNPARTVKERPA